ncbi:ribosome small subunit-dependent GTPase A [Tropicimonas sp. TH_r6]|uniref:ribosome small subunit-dependent GTPase A n=1 Tax=Tropicimonas sp. TH_r6 TaxID=3082085 RepID=UPI002953609D|nr:ribosome small subunit-dependent GTPase A [Tropicimonas sp. TH_r6]MDV7142033.1 ribosome small subunit-dependent GTPase A [Tropicimonas sp. TH_r6]
MTRDFSQFFSSAATPDSARRDRPLIEKLGWQPFFAQQTNADALTQTPPVRVVEVHRNGLHVIGDGIDALVPPRLEATVGDWLLFDRENPADSELLHRKSLFKRRAPGKERHLQLIAANIDTAFIVTSCNDDFNVARLERYLALSFEAEVEPVILLTKTDLCSDIAPFTETAGAISDRVVVVELNALSAEPAARLAPWCRPGQTVAFLGSSGVGKSTLVNALFGEEAVETSGIREDDSKGRHTTTRRQLHLVPQGCTVLDTPGMRELQLADALDGIADLFDDLANLATRCRFNDCQHETEPGCAIRAGLESGEVDPARLSRWQKLAAEERFNSASLAERRANDKAFGKMVRSVMEAKKKRKR